MVQTAKRILKKNKDPYKALMDYRNTEIQGLGKSPAQMFLGRRLKTNLPATADLLRPAENNQHAKLQARQMQYKEFHDRRGTRNLPDLHPGDNVMLQDGNTWRHATVESKLSLPKSFLVSCDGKQYRRNRSMLKPTKSEKPKQEVSEDFDLQIPDRDGPTDIRSKSIQESTSASVKESEEPRQTRSGRTVKIPSKFADYVT